jgi:hypothetical protein
MSSLSCPNCGKPKKEWAKVCWKCHTDEVVEDAYQRGVADGKADIPKLEKSLYRKLVQLTHPDKHGGAKAAVEVTQWLNSVKP